MLLYQQVLEESEQGISELTIPERLLRLSRDDLYWEKEALFDDCEILQKALLREICQRGEGSEYAKDHGFAKVCDLDSWRVQVPVSTYTDYLPYIEAEMNGSAHQLYQADTKLYVATTGSTGKIKLFMESAAGNDAKLLVMAVRGMYMGTLLPVTRDMEAKNLTISNYLQLGIVLWQADHACFRTNSTQSAQKNWNNEYHPDTILGNLGYSATGSRVHGRCVCPG